MKKVRATNRNEHLVVTAVIGWSFYLIYRDIACLANLCTNSFAALMSSG